MEEAAMRAVAMLYHRYFTGLLLTVASRRGAAEAGEFVFRLFRRQLEESLGQSLAFEALATVDAHGR